MKSFNAAQRVVSLIFISSVFIYFFLNIHRQRYDILYGLSFITPPAHASEYAEKAREVESVLDYYTYRREHLINMYSYLQALLGKEENGNFDIVRSKEGYLNYGDFYHDIPKELEEYALRVRRLKDYANSGGSEVIFLNPLPINVDGYHTYSAGLPYQDENIFMDAMLFYLQGFGVDCLDMRTALKDSGLGLEKYRYKTDPHWTIEASFEGFRSIVRALEDKYGETLDPDGFYTNPDNYESVLISDSMFGSLGSRAGMYFSGREDFTMLLPGFSTLFSHERDDSGEITRVEGDFSEALIDDYYLSTDNLYMAYLGGLSPFRSIDNENNREGARILFLSDSFSLPLAAFLSAAVGETDMIYTRSQEVFGYSIDIDEYIAENAGYYDYIFVELSPGSYSESGFSFSRD